MGYVPYYLSGFGLSVMLVRLFMQPAFSIGLVDAPGGRKRHADSVPLIGGITMFVAFLAVVTALWPFPSRAYASLLGGMALLVTVGALDDRLGLRANPRLFTQIVAALILTFGGGLQIASLGDVLGFGAVDLGLMAIPFTIICVVAFINAINMLDGFDGLAGGIVVVALLWLAAFAGFASINHNSVTLMVMLAFVVAGFLTLNMRSPWRKQAKVFMGDAGSTMLGFAVAWFAIYLAQAEGGTIELPPMSVAWILALPVYDTVTVMTRRILKRRSPLHAGRDHLHHLLLRAGLTPSQVVVTMLGLTALGGAIGFSGLAFGVPEALLFPAFIATGFAHLWFSVEGWKYLKRARITLR